MRKLLIAAVVPCLCALAQSPTDVFSKAPPKVDEALRERVAIFFKAHVEGKFRQAEVVVAEDSKDAFYNAEKTRYLGFEIAQIEYSDNYTKATVMTAVEMDWSTPRLGKIRVKPPLKTLWRVDNGQWYWYVIPQKTWETPWGTMHPGADPAPGVAAQWTVPDAAAVLRQVGCNKSEIRLSSFEKSEDVAEITSNMQGEVNLRLEQVPVATGLEIKIDREALQPGQTARVTFKYAPPDRAPKATLNASLTVLQTGQTFPFRITFAVPPEFEKYLQKK